MEKKLTKEFADNLMKIKGEARGMTLKTDAEFVLKKQGEQALKEVQQELEKIGQPIRYKSVKAMAFYPIGLRILSLLAIQKVLNLSKKEVKIMGKEAPKMSLIIKLFAKFFFSITKSAEQAPRMWAKHYTDGELNVEVDEKQRYAVILLKGLNLHPLFCVYLEGYFSTIIQMIVNTYVRSSETECSFQGDEHHKFLLKW